MATKYYVDTEGNYLGGFEGSAPANATEVANPPAHGRAKWLNNAWEEPVPDRVIGKNRIQRFLETNGKWDFFKRIRDSKPTYIDNWESKEAINKDDDLLRVVARGLKTTPDAILEGAEAITDAQLELTVDERLEEAKNHAKALVNAERDKRKFADLEYNGHFYSVSEWDMLMIMSLLTTSNAGKALPTDNYWRTADHVNVNLKNNDLDNLDSLIKQQIQDSYTWSWIKKAEIDACNAIDEVDALNLELS